MIRRVPPPAAIFIMPALTGGGDSLWRSSKERVERIFCGR